MKAERILTDKILLVDDDPKVLDALRAMLRGRFNVSTALGAETGLQMLRSAGPFAVVVSDFKMPGMNGVEFLSLAREISPCTVRVMLTGYADMDTAVAAVNTGEVFRFHTKPCPAASLRQTLQDALDKFHIPLPGVSRQIPPYPAVRGKTEGEATDEGKTVTFGVLTAKELRITELIRMDYSSKEIASIMCVSVRTVETHRENIRRKLGLTNEKVNLQSYLKST